MLYRPFTKLWLYEDDLILSRVKTVSAMFPRDLEAESGQNIDQTPPPGILVTCPSNMAVFGTLASRALTDLKGVGTIQACRALPSRRS